MPRTTKTNEKKGKTPGSDGLSTDFYQHFWKLLAPHLLKSFEETFLQGELTTEQRRGVIILIPKKGKNPMKLKNWRPITLLNLSLIHI